METSASRLDLVIVVKHTINYSYLNLVNVSVSTVATSFDFI
jgi:hypothetical protein